MTGADDRLRQLAQAHGVHLGFHDLHGAHHSATPDTLRALLRGLGIAADTDAGVNAALHALERDRHGLPKEHIVCAGETSSLPFANGAWVLTDEAGRSVAEGVVTQHPDLPALEVGYYHLQVEVAAGTEECFVLARPKRAPDLHSQTGLDRCWGATGALYGLRSHSNGGLGNYGDLGDVSVTLAARGAQFFGVNPLHALGWAMSDIISPYSPSHRGVFNTDHIAAPDGLGPSPECDLIDYAAFRAKHRVQLAAAFDAFEASAGRTAFDTWCRSCSDDIRQFAVFEAISEVRGFDFRTWPDPLRRPGPDAEAAAGTRAGFHLWLQWLAETQVATAHDTAKAAGMSLGLYLDLAVGPRPDGAEVWMNANTIAHGVTIGAPPDHLSPEGQSWALAAHAPGKLAAAQYRPMRAMLRSLMANCGLLRIDHALGLLRSFWIPEDGSPGGYITQPLEALLAVIAIEAHRAGCVVVGEDLGLVPDGFRATLNEAGLYSYAVWQFETTHLGEIRPADSLPPYSLACFGTHDTPTLQGYWHGADIEWWHKVGWISSGERAQRHATRARQRGSLRKANGIPAHAASQDISDTLHAKLASSSAALVSVQLDDVFGALDAQNLPGTVDAHPNWRRRTGVSLEDMRTMPHLARIAEVMRPRAAPQRFETKPISPKEVSHDNPDPDLHAI